MLKPNLQLVKGNRQQASRARLMWSSADFKLGHLTPRLNILSSLLLLLLLGGVALARSYQYLTVPFAKLRSMASFEARVDSIVYWDQKEIKIADKPALWVYVTQANGARVMILWQDATIQHVSFARSLHLSNTYRFPEVWDEFVTSKSRK